MAKTKKNKKVADFFKNLGIGVLTSTVSHLGKQVSNIPEVKKASEKEVGNLLGKYKWYIVGVVGLFALLPLTISIISTRKK